MCGIFCSIITFSKHSHKPTDCSCNDLLYKSYKELLINRGPDIQSLVKLNTENIQILLASSVLWLQGPQPIEQPAYKNNSYLLFNGDVFGGDLISQNVRDEFGDTLPLLEALTKTSSITETLQKIHGPYSLIFYNRSEHKLHFCRDPYGRRSLLIGIDDGQIIITSVAKRNSTIQLIELPPIGVFTFDLNTTNFESIVLTPWKIHEEILEKHICNLEINLKIKIVKDNSNTFVSEIASEEPSSINNFKNMSSTEILTSLSIQLDWKKRIDELTVRLRSSVNKRIITQPERWKYSIGILFSGGLDCTILAVLAHQCLPILSKIDLFNVSFEKTDTDYETPDRITARLTFEELERLFPNRTWKLHEINITQNELNIKRSEHITHLIYPLNTILDESLGCALWFASRCETNEATSWRVLLSGQGADELFGGYTRHRNALRRGGWKSLTAELETDWVNLPHRNLARDDRIISDHGRQLRTPYLDEEVVEYVRKLNTWEKCCPNDYLPVGVGDKLLLRLVAYNLGLQQSCLFKKRALQFGSRIANKKENAKDVSPRL